MQNDEDYLDPTLEDEIIESEPESEEEGEDYDPLTESDPKRLQKMLRDAKAALTKKSMEAAEMQGRLKAVEDREQYSAESAEDWLDSYSDDDIADMSSMKDIIKKFRGEVVEAFGEFGRRTQAQMQAYDPEMRELQDEIEELRVDPDYQGFSDAQLKVIARKGRNLNQARKPRGSVGGKRAAKERSSYDPKKSALFKEIYPDFVEEEDAS